MSAKLSFRNVRCQLALVLGCFGLWSVTSSAQAATYPFFINSASFYPGDGLFNTRGIDISGGGVGENDTEINSLPEAEALLAMVNTLTPGYTGLVTVGASTYNVTINVTSTASQTNFGGGGDFGSDLPFPGGMGGDDFLMGFEAYVYFPAGTYTLFADGDDGSRVNIAGAAFTERINTDGPQGVDEIRFNSPTGGHDTAGVFTVAQDMITTISAVWYERGGGERWEVSIDNDDRIGPVGLLPFIVGGSGNNANSLGFTVLSENIEGGILFSSSEFVIPVPEPSTFALLGLGMVGLAVRRRRRAAA